MGGLPTGSFEGLIRRILPRALIGVERRAGLPAPDASASVRETPFESDSIDSADNSPPVSCSRPRAGRGSYGRRWYAARMAPPVLDRTRPRDDRWSALLLAILAAVGIAICVYVARLFPTPPDWDVQHSSVFELREGAEGTWSPKYAPESARFPCRILRVVGDVHFRNVRDEGLRVVARITPRDAACTHNLREHGVDGWIPVESSWELEVDPPRVERIDWRVESRPGAVVPGPGGRVMLQIYGIEDSAIDLETPATVAAVALALFVLIPALVWCRREAVAVRAGR